MKSELGKQSFAPPAVGGLQQGGGTIYLRSHFYNAERDPVLWDLDWDWLLVGEDSE